jgi:hypothetical protein
MRAASAVDVMGRGPAPESKGASGIDGLARFIQDLRMERRKQGGDFADFERKVHERMMSAEREVIAEEMAAADTDADAIVIEGRTFRRVLRSAQTYMTAAGPVEVTRNLYKDRTREDEDAVSPLEKRLGIVEGFWTPRAAEQGLWVVTQMTPGKAEELFGRVGNMQPSKSSLDRLPKALNERWEADRAGFEEALREAVVVPEEARCVGVSLDGVLAPMVDAGKKETRAETAEEGRLTRGPAGYREVGCGALSFFDEKGEMLSAIRMARAPEEKKESLKRQLHEELLVVLAKNPRLRIAKIADGADDNWTYLSEVIPDGVEVIDFFHACEHLNGALGAAYGDGTMKARHRFEALREVLRDEEDGVTSVIRALEYLKRTNPGDVTIKRALGYFRKHRERMQYRTFAKAGLPIGSGVIEAACKTLVGQRLKLSGMRWSAPGAQAILTTRGWDQSDRFDAAWALLAATYQTQITVLSNVIPLRPKGARASR